MPLLLSAPEMPDGLVRILPLKAFWERCESAEACLVSARIRFTQKNKCPSLLRFERGLIMKPTWSQKEVLPMVRDTIYALCKKKGDWVTKQETVTALLEDPRISKSADEAYRLQKTDKTHILRNMVDWLDFWVTKFEGKKPMPDWACELATKILDEFERKKIDRKWAYKLR